MDNPMELINTIMKNPAAIEGIKNMLGGEQIQTDTPVPEEQITKMPSSDLPDLSFITQFLASNPQSINVMNKMNPSYSTNINLYSVAYPITNYVHNDLFDNQLLLTPTIQKVHSEVTTMYQTSEMQGLKQKLLELNKEYPMVKPSLYVWEYENGQYVNIDANELYPAASIIKLPVLIRLFKSICAR